MRSSSLLNAFVTRDGAAAVTGDKIAACAVSTTKLADGAVTSAKIGADAEGANQLQDGIHINMQDQQLTRPQLKDFPETSTTPVISALAWPGSLRWAGGIASVVTSAANAIDVYAFVTRDAGRTWYGFPGGQDFA